MYRISPPPPSPPNIPPPHTPSPPSLSPVQCYLVTSVGLSGNTYATPANLGPVLAIGAGFSYTIALMTDGTVTCWLRQNSGINFNVCNVPVGLANVVSIAAGFSHAMALLSNGTVVVWGSYVDIMSSPIVSFGAAYGPTTTQRIVALAGGSGHSLALTSTGSVIAWGLDNRYNQLSVPTGIGVGGYGQPVTSISAYALNNIALRSGGAVVVWGSSVYGQLIIPASVSSSAINLVSAGYNFYVVAVAGDGGVVVWGQNVAATMNPPAGVVGVVALAGGVGYASALLRGGTVVEWGSDFYGFASIIPASLTGVAGIAAGYYQMAAMTQCQPRPPPKASPPPNPPPSPPSNFKPPAFFCTVVSSIVPPTSQLSYGYYTWSPAPASLGAVTAIAAGHMHTIALRYDGTVACWLPPNTTDTYQVCNVPAGLANVVLIGAGELHGFAKTSNGAMFVWGTYLYWTPLTYVAVYTPVFLPAAVLRQNITAFAGGESHSLVLTDTGKVISWGVDNSDGQMDMPASIGLSNTGPRVTSISVMRISSSARLSDGSIVTWGSGTPNVPFPIPPSVSASYVTMVNSGYFFWSALLANGSIAQWSTFVAANSWGQTTPPSNMGEVTAVLSGYSYSSALLKNGTVMVWGQYFGTGMAVNIQGVVALAAGARQLVAMSKCYNTSIPPPTTPSPPSPSTVCEYVLQIYVMLAT